MAGLAKIGQFVSALFSQDGKALGAWAVLSVEAVASGGKATLSKDGYELTVSSLQPIESVFFVSAHRAD